MDEICRLCLTDTTTYDEYSSYYDKIHHLMPEIDLNITPTFILCEDCSNDLNKAYAFKQKCLQIEERIRNYISEIQTPLTNLRCVKDKNYKDSNESLKVKVEDAYDDFEIDSMSNLTSQRDCKDIHSIKEEYHLTFPKEEIFQQDNDECASNCCKEEIEESQENESLKVFICEICMESFNKSIELDQHRILHSETNIFPCDSCNKKFTKESYLTQHKIIHLNEAIQYYCDICSKGFKRKQHLNNHKEIHNTKTYTCSICSKSCRYLRRHMRNCHMRKHICQVCGMKYGTESILLQHMRTHTGDRPYKCGVCGKGFMEKGTLTVHLRTHQNGKPYVCNICQKAYTLKVSLDSHMTVHNLERTFVCEITTCNKRFKTAKVLYNHMRRHKTGKAHQCNLCDKGFFDSTALRSHMRCHTGERPYECDICRENFSYKASLQKHLKSHRPKKI